MTVKFPDELADVAHVPPDTPTSSHDPAAAAGAQARLRVEDGAVLVEGAPTDAPGRLTWPATVDVEVDGAPVTDATTCRVQPGQRVVARPRQDEARVDYDVEVARDRMLATLVVRPRQGTRRRLLDAPADTHLRLEVDERTEPAPDPALGDARSALAAAEVSFGIDEDQVATAVATPGSTFEVAHGRDAVVGRDGSLQPLLDLDAARRTGVLAQTPLIRRVRARHGSAGMDVTGREINIPKVKEAKLRAGDGVSIDAGGVLAISTVDGSPSFDGQSFIEVRHELVLDEVDGTTGDVDFTGAVRVIGDVHEGRRVVARHAVTVAGNVDRAVIESGGRLEVRGSIMSSSLRAGGERAVAARIADRVLSTPRRLAEASTRATELRQAAGKRGQELAFGLSMQLVLERLYRNVLGDLESVAVDLREAGPTHASTAEDVERWHRMLATAANTRLGQEDFMQMLQALGALADDVQRAVEQASDLDVAYMQSSEAEATGAVTISGKGIFNSRITAWGGLVATSPEAVVRGGLIASHGDVRVREIGTPSGARTTVQLARGATIDADRVRAGVVVDSPGHVHRFIADRSSVRVDFDSSGAMNVESLAA